MIDFVNEITVWLDQLEEDGQDVFSFRLLCNYNYLSNSIWFGHINVFHNGTLKNKGDGYRYEYEGTCGHGIIVGSGNGGSDGNINLYAIASNYIDNYGDGYMNGRYGHGCGY